MLFPLVVGSLLMVINLGFQVLAVTILVRYFMSRINKGTFRPTFFNDVRALAIVMSVLLLGHFLQFATWAILFTWFGEFEDFATAFYHSTVNFTSLGYGDIVMTEQHRLLGALEAANGVLMFGLSAGTILMVMNRLFDRRQSVTTLKQNLVDHP